MAKLDAYAGACNTDVRKPQTFTKKVDLVLSFFVCWSFSNWILRKNWHKLGAEANPELVLRFTSVPAALPQTARQNASGFLNNI